MAFWLTVFQSAHVPKLEVLGLNIYYLIIRQVMKVQLSDANSALYLTFLGAMYDVYLTYQFRQAPGLST